MKYSIIKAFWKDTSDEFKIKYRSLYKKTYNKQTGRLNPVAYQLLTRAWSQYIKYNKLNEQRRINKELRKEIKRHNKEAVFKGYEDLLKLY